MTSLDAATVELATARKIFWLLANDYIFLSTYNDDTKDWDGGAYPCINCNDVFVPGADAENLAAEDLDLYIEACKSFGDAAPVAWCAVHRNASPWRNPTSSTWAATLHEAKLGIENLLAHRNASGSSDASSKKTP